MYGLILAIIIFFVSILPVCWYHKLIVFGIFLSILTLLFLFNAWFQNKIVELKIKLENTWRKI
ncbi:MAG: hypothetical protein NC820_07290 [Candidatus Omnitrophica bacterium]|nr:hypothetical protein [Candidatus Omnitrophota bacterium]